MGNTTRFGATRFGGSSNFHFEITPDIIEWMNEEGINDTITVEGFEYNLSIKFTTRYMDVPKILSIRLDKIGHQVRTDNVRNRGTTHPNISIEIPYIEGGLTDINLVGIQKSGGCLDIKQIILNGQRYIPGNGINEQREYCVLERLKSG